MDHSTPSKTSGCDSPSAKRTPTCILRDFLLRLARLELTGKIYNISPAMKDVGGFSDVFVGYCQCSGGYREKVAIKRLRVHLKTDEGFQKKLANEIHIWSKLDHAYILPLHGFFFEDDDYPSLVSEWMENGTVLTYLDSNPECDLQQMVAKIAEGLDYLHTKDIVHSDIKPENILISSSGQPRICDFGVSRILAASSSFNFTLSASGGLKGTIRYVAIELFTATDQESCEFSKASDVWAFGMTVLALLTRRVPYFNINYDVGVMFAITSGKLPALPEDSESWLEPQQFLWKLCNRCWYQLPFERPSMSHIVTALRSFENRTTEAWTEAASLTTISYNRTLEGTSQRHPLMMERLQYPATHGPVADARHTYGNFYATQAEDSKARNFLEQDGNAEIWKIKHHSEEDYWGTWETSASDLFGEQPLKLKVLDNQHVRYSDPTPSSVFTPSASPSPFPISLYHPRPSSWRQVRQSSEPPPHLNPDPTIFTLGHNIIRTQSAPPVVQKFYLDGQAYYAVTKNHGIRKNESLSQPGHVTPTTAETTERPSKRIKVNKRRQRGQAEPKPLRRSARIRGSAKVS